MAASWQMTNNISKQYLKKFFRMACKAPIEGPYRMYSCPAILNWFYFQWADYLWLAQNYHLTFAGDTYPQRKNFNQCQTSPVQSKGNTCEPQAVCVWAKALPSNTGQSSAVILHSTQNRSTAFSSPIACDSPTPTERGRMWQTQTF